MTNKRKKAIIRRRIFVSLVVALFATIIALIFVIVATIKHSKNFSSDTISSENSSLTNSSLTSSTTSDTSTSEIEIEIEDDTLSSQAESQESSIPDVYIAPTGTQLDASFSRLLLTNGENPLPEEYDSKVVEYLVEIDPIYRNNNYRTKIHKDVYPYITAMVAAAQADGVDLRVLSPFRSYSVQEGLFKNQVARVGGDEAKAATVVARPGTSEHNTGLCADFNMAEDTFENTPMYEWMCENAEDYGFILRYPKDKQHITGVIYESWHWRFVGINNAKEINSLGLTLEEYIEYKGFEPTIDMYGDD